jgi:ABC-type sugar transport system ATPase subunit
VFQVADRIYVLRLGRKGGDFDAKDVSQEQIVGAMTGAELNHG